MGYNRDMDKQKSERQSGSGGSGLGSKAGPAWDSHNLAELCEDVATGRGKRVTIAPDVYERIEEEARRRGVSPETLIQVWLVERLEEGKKS